MIGQVSHPTFSLYSYDFRKTEAREAEPTLNAGEQAKAKGEKEGDKKSQKLENESLSPEEKQQVRELEKRDAQVRTHEQAHLAATGSLALGGINYEYQTGPDGKRYAVGGNVKIDTSPGRTPEETIRKAEKIKAAALAPADPSPQDMRVAATASSMAADAQMKLSKSADPNEKTGNTSPERDPFDGSIDSSKRIFPSTPTEAHADSENEDDNSQPQSPFAALIAKAYGTK